MCTCYINMPVYVFLCLPMLSIMRVRVSILCCIRYFHICEEVAILECKLFKSNKSVGLSCREKKEKQHRLAGYLLQCMICFEQS